VLFPGSKVKARYRADTLLGRGGMGEVWKVFDETLERSIVLKVVSPDLAKARPQHTPIFLDEAKIGASLVGHPNVVTIFDVFNEVDGGNPLLAIAMEFVHGLSCAEWIDYSSNNLDRPTKHYISLQIATEVCKALQYAHRNGILHRDIKPLNIFISKYGITKIGDFGIARYVDAVTREHTVWNFKSPAYSAPEQWKNEKPSKATDIYQLGSTLFHLFTGKLPFEADSVAALIQKHLVDDPPNPRMQNDLLSEELANVIQKCLAKLPASRPAIWQVFDALNKEVQQDYRMRIEIDKTNGTLIKQITNITEFKTATLKDNGKFSIVYVDYNEAISEAIELILLGNVKVQLEKIVT